MALTALDIKDKTFKLKFRGYDEEEVNEFLDIVVDDYEDLVRRNHEQENRIKDLEDKLAYFDEMKESLSQSVILAQETAEKVKTSANDEAANLVSKANYDAQHLIDEAKSKANQILRDATDEAKRVAVETEDLNTCFPSTFGSGYRRTAWFNKFTRMDRIVAANSCLPSKLRCCFP